VAASDVEALYLASDAAICGTSGLGHRYRVDVTAYTASDPGQTLVTTAVSGSDRYELPCPLNNCVLPGSMRIALATPADGDRYLAPAAIFAKAKLSHLTGTPDEVAIALDGNWVDGTPDTESGSYFATFSNVAARSTPYLVEARVRQGAVTLYSPANAIYVDPTTATTISLGPPSGSLTAPASLTLTATVGGDSVGVTSVDFVDGLNRVLGTATSSGASWAALWTGAGAGSYTIRARARNATGVLLAVSAPVTVTVTGWTAGTEPIDPPIVDPATQIPNHLHHAFGIAQGRWRHAAHALAQL
jgi:hypothetical protein